MPRYIRRKKGDVKSSNGCGDFEPPVKKAKNQCEEKVLDTFLAVVCNPWQEHENPKFPDGRAQYSVGRRHVNAEEVKYTSVPDGRTDQLSDKETSLIVLFAGINNHCVMVQEMDCATDLKGSMTTQDAYMGQLDSYVGALLSNHYSKTGVAFNSDIKMLDADQSYIPEVALHRRLATLTPTSASFKAWRPVSVGLRIKCLNNETEDGGWFEAIRTSRNLLTDLSGSGKLNGNPFGVAFQHDFYTKKVTWDLTDDNIASVLPGVTATDKSKKITAGNLLPSIGFISRNTHEDLSDWGAHQSYCQGKITDLDCVEFQLNCVKKANEFIPIRPIQMYNAWPEWSLLEGTALSLARSTSTLFLNKQWLFANPNFNNLFRSYDPASHGLVPRFSGEDMHNMSNEQTLPQQWNIEDTRDTLQPLYSDAFDIIMIRIHGKRGKTKLFLETVCNREYLVQDNGPYAEYQTPSYSDADALYDVLDYRNQKFLRPMQRLRGDWRDSYADANFSFDPETQAANAAAAPKTTTAWNTGD